MRKLQEKIVLNLYLSHSRREKKVCVTREELRSPQDNAYLYNEAITHTDPPRHKAERHHHHIKPSLGTPPQRPDPWHQYQYAARAGEILVRERQAVASIGLSRYHEVVIPFVEI